ncbi:MAG TPA: amidohydrolase family protein [Sphingomicrobium sp.]|nr:amidohydrolase family protein [Sphingomicrobium sp.]
MPRLIAQMLAVLAAATVAVVPAPARDAPQIGAVRNVHIVDVQSGLVIRDQTVVIADGKIRQIGPAQNVPIPFGAKVLDGDGGFLIPGLIDTHAHLWWDGDTLDEKPLRQFLQQGVTTIRHAGRGGRAALGIAAREAAAQDRFLSPRLVISGMVNLRSVDRHAVTNPAALAERLVELGVDGLKIREGLTINDVREVIRIGRRTGIPVYGHTNDNGLSGRDYSLVAVEEGIAGLMHVPDLISRPGGAPGDPADWQAQWLWWRSIWDIMPQSEQDRLIESMVRRGAWLEPTLITDHWIAYDAEHLAASERRGVLAEATEARQGFPTYSGADLELYRRAYRNIESFVRKFAEAGGTVLAGTDCVPVCGFIQDELTLLVRAGLSPHQALRAATVDAAKALGRPDVGQVRVGYHADMVLLRGNPLDDIRQTENIAAVLLGGILLSEATDAAR